MISVMGITVIQNSELWPATKLDVGSTSTEPSLGTQGCAGTNRSSQALQIDFECSDCLNLRSRRKELCPEPKHARWLARSDQKYGPVPEGRPVRNGRTFPAGFPRSWFKTCAGCRGRLRNSNPQSSILACSSSLIADAEKRITRQCG